MRHTTTATTTTDHLVAAGVDLSGLNSTELSELKVHLAKGTFDFTISNLRFIDQNFIDLIMVEELRADQDHLGSFAPWTLVQRLLNHPLAYIESLQAAAEFRRIGELLLGQPNAVEELQRSYTWHRGYGAHFSPDGKAAVECGQYVICCQ